MSLYQTHAHLLVVPKSRSPSSSHHHHKDPTRQQVQPNPQASESTSSLGLGAKIRSAFDSQKYANFEAKISIHEISNVPQLQGEFNCNWKFRGKHPKTRDGGESFISSPHDKRVIYQIGGADLAVSHKPSLPNLRLTQVHSRHQDSTTSLPVRSVSDDKAKHPIPSGSSTPSIAMKGKSMSTPPLSLSLGHFLPTGKHRSVEKKGSDPTPLRNSLIGSDLQPVESPASTSDLHDDTPVSRAMGGDSASSSLYNPTSTAASSTSYLSVPVPRHSTDGIETTGSTSTSTSTPTPAEIPMERSGSRQTMSTSMSTAMSKSKSTNPTSTHRSGTTPNRPLDKNHTCTWDQEIYLTLRLPISKSQERKEEYGIKSNSPLLGEGPKSASGLRLLIQQLPSASATSTTHPKLTESEVHHPPAHSGAIHPVSVDKEKEEDKGKHEKHEKVGTHHPKGKATAFGRVDIDLAAFAGKGRTTRKFLLKGSRTNATVQITVEMTWVGGDRDWVA
jgi:hypothetical protein